MGLRLTLSQSTAQSTPGPHTAWRQLPMSSYYREHVSFPNVAAGPYPPHLVASLERDTADTNNATPSTSRADGMSDPRLCSVKGCSSSLPADYPHKMCEECRGRHRVYAMTKRAKRKMEKALLNGSSPQNGQNVVWMPQDDGSKLEQEQEQEPAHPPEPVAGPSRQYEDEVCTLSIFITFVHSRASITSRTGVSGRDVSLFA